MPTATAPVNPPAADTDQPGQAMINDKQMRQMHALFHAHGWADRADILDLLTVHLGRPVESRKELTLTEAADVIAWLEAEPRVATPANLADLRRPFPSEAVGKLPRSTCKACSEVAKRYQACERHHWVRGCAACKGNHSDAMMHLDYVGHADVTARLLDVDPHWTWRPFTPDELNGLPPALRDGLWIQMTVLGITRPGYGSTDGKPGGNGIKEAIGDALRNGAMRFGVALELWTKGDREWAQEGGAAEHGGSTADSSAPWDGPTTEQLVAELEGLAAGQGTDLAGITQKWRGDHGNVAVENLVNIDPWNLAPLVDRVKAYIAQQQNASGA